MLSRPYQGDRSPHLWDYLVLRCNSRPHLGFLERNSMLASRVLLRLTTFAVAFASALGFNQAGATDLALKDAVSMAGKQLYLNSGATSLLILAVRGDDTVIDAYGDTYPATGVDPDEHSIFRIGSVSEAFVT